MKLSQTKTLCILNNHQTCIRDIDPNLNYSCCNEKLSFSRNKPIHDFIFDL